MALPKIRALTTSLMLVGVATLTSVAAVGPAQSAATTSPVVVSINAKRVVSMPTTVQPGVNTFKVTSAAKRGSGFQLVLPAAGYTAAEAARDVEKGLDGGNVQAIKRFEANVTLLGGMTADDTADTLMVDLDPGSYWAVDTNASTTDPAKFFTFTVEGVDTGNVLPAATTIKAVQATSWAAKPASIPNKGLLRFKNAASNNHFIVLAKLKKGMTYHDFKEWLAQQGPGGPPPLNFGVGLASGAVSPGHSAIFNYNLPKGDYVMLCFWPDASMGGMPHAFMGMHRAITLK